MNLFLSYTSEDREKLRPLLDGLHRLKYTVWFDQELSGGQQWWDAILERIRESDALLVGVSPAVIESDACAREIEYAREVGKPILPVMIAPVRPDLLLPALAALQIVDFSDPGHEAAFDLMNALRQLPPPKPLPDPLPEPPAAPFSYLSGLQRIHSPTQLSLDEQLALVGKLKLGLARPRDRDAVVELIRGFKLRDDLYYAVARELESIPLPAGDASPVADPAPRIGETAGHSATAEAATQTDAPAQRYSAMPRKTPSRPDLGAPASHGIPATNLAHELGRRSESETIGKLGNQSLSPWFFLLLLLGALLTGLLAFLLLNVTTVKYPDQSIGSLDIFSFHVLTGVFFGLVALTCVAGFVGGVRNWRWGRLAAAVAGTLLCVTVVGALLGIPILIVIAMTRHGPQSAETERP